MTDFSYAMDLEGEPSPGNLVECRICHDEDEDSNMETPCSCSGTLKYCHRKCVQRWCNEKGDIVCEICHQQFQPGYTVPPPLFHCGGISMNFRGNWEVSRRDLNNPHFLAMVTTDGDFIDNEFVDYSVSASRSLIFSRVVATIFVVLLVLRHTLPIMISGADDYTFTSVTLQVLSIITLLLSVHILVITCRAIKHQQQPQEALNFSLATSDEEMDLPQLQPQPRLIRLQ